MIYLIALLNGMISISSPCIIGMIPLYVVYLEENKISKKQLMYNALGIIIALTLLSIIFKMTIVSLSYFWYYRYAIIILIIVFVLNHLQIIRLPMIKVPNIQGKWNIVTGTLIAFTWIPCISYFLFPLIISTNQMTLIESIFVYLLYSIGILIPIVILTISENTLLKKIKSLSIRHQATIKNIAFIVLMLSLVFLFLTTHTR